MLESDVHLASVNITVLGLTNLDAYLKRMYQLYIANCGAQTFVQGPDIFLSIILNMCFGCSKEPS